MADQQRRQSIADGLVYNEVDRKIIKRWNYPGNIGTATTVSYYFLQDKLPSYYDGTDFGKAWENLTVESLGNNSKAKFREAFTLWENVSKIKFVEAASADDADINIGYIDGFGFDNDAPIKASRALTVPMEEDPRDVDEKMGSDIFLNYRSYVIRGRTKPTCWNGVKYNANIGCMNA